MGAGLAMTWRILSALGLGLILAACSGGTADNTSASRATYQLVFTRIGALLQGGGGHGPRALWHHPRRDCRLP